MNGSRLVRCVLWSLALCVVACGSAGCGLIPHDFWLEPTSGSGVPAGFEQAKPGTGTPKPADAAEDSDDRHPWRWRQKLRAKYA